jgi:L-serine ammonia-lyase (EC 4.3.1.17)
MSVSVFDLFKIGIGPSSSHTLGPMKAARTFVADLAEAGVLEAVASVRVTLHGSLAATARGHATDRAVVLGLLGERPDAVAPEEVTSLVEEVRRTGRLALLGRREVPFLEGEVLRLELEPLAYHPNGLVLAAFGPAGETIANGRSSRSAAASSSRRGLRERTPRPTSWSRTRSGPRRSSSPPASGRRSGSAGWSG